MNRPITLITLHDELEVFCNNHKQIKRFEFEYEEQLPNLSTEGKTFPFIFVTPIDMRKKNNMFTHTLRIFIYDRIDRDRTNVLDITNDNSLIISDLIKWWNEDNEKSEIMLENEPTVIAENNERLDYLQGYSGDFIFSIPSYSRCDIPIKK